VEMGIAYQRCSGAVEIVNQCDNTSSCCFNVIMDSTLWCLIVSIFSEENKGKVRLEVFQLKMLIDNPNKIEKRLNFI